MLAFTLAIVRYGIILRFIGESPEMQNTTQGVFILMSMATILIAAAGYIINDFYDLKIDLLNKPSQMVLGRVMSTTRGIVLYIALNAAGLAAGLAASLKTGQPSLFLIFLLTASLLWYYSVFLKRYMLWGNLAVASLTALAVIMPLVFEFYLLLENPEEWAQLFRSFRLATRLTLAMALFAFLLTFIREILKDAEDMKGDAAENCRTLPLVLGWPRTRDILSGLILLTIVLLGIAQYYLSQSGFRWAFFWYFVPQFLLIHLFSKLPVEPRPERLASATRIAKGIMLAGVAGIVLLFP